MPSNWPPPPYHPFPLLVLSIITALLLLAFPPCLLTHRLLLFNLFCLPASYAFVYHQHLTPWYGINDTLGRLLYIWGVHMSWVVLVLGARPVDEAGSELRTGDVRGRVKWAWKVLFARSVGGYWPRWTGRGGVPEKKMGMGRAMQAHERSEITEGLGRRRGERPHFLAPLPFAIHHSTRLLLCLALNHVWDTYINTLSPTGPLTTRFLMTWDTCISDALYFTTHYSFVALLCVSLLRLDAPAEWSLSIFGSLADCSTVRRYWGVYWHDYIGASFSAHAQLLTRRVLGWEHPSAGRRVVENTCVFVASGLGHAAVRYVSTEGRGEVWAVAIWYTAQMLPIGVESPVGYFWEMSRARSWVGKWVGGKVLRRAERTVGYVWVFAWMFWSVPMYLLTRNKWEMEGWRRNHPELFGGVQEGVNGGVGVGE